MDPLLFWLVVGLVVGAVLRSVARPSHEPGAWGEKQVRSRIERRLPSTTYRSLHDVTLPTPDGTTQIDHIVVSPFGVFVIETKTLAGWIFGHERSRRWTQNLYGNNYQFFNPLRQNYKHVKAVERILNLDPRSVHSVVVFAGDSDFRTEVPANVLELPDLIPYIRSKRELQLSDAVVEDAVQRLSSARVPISEAGDVHLGNLGESRWNPRCPRCGQEMVLRTARRGPNPGSQFWGCPGYPRCTATKSVA